MSARAWAARKGHPVARAERAEHLRCRTLGCILNRRKHWVHMIPAVPPSFAYGTNRLGRRKARRSATLMRRAK